MTPLGNRSFEQLRKVLAIREQIGSLEDEPEGITGEGGGAVLREPSGRKKMSFAVKARLAAAARKGQLSLLTLLGGHRKWQNDVDRR